MNSEGEVSERTEITIIVTISHSDIRSMSSLKAKVEDIKLSSDKEILHHWQSLDLPKGIRRE